MSMYLVARSTHIVAMLLTVVLTMAAEPLLLHAARARSLEQVERWYRLAQRLRQLSQLTMLIGLLAAIALVILARWNPLAPWLVATYGLLVLMSVVARFGTEAWQRQLQSTLRPQTGGVALADVRGLLADRPALLARLAIIAIFLTVIVVMREKPSFGL